MNWLDILLGAILVISVIAGFLKGFARTGIGFAALVIGVFSGLWFYPSVGAFLGQYIGSRSIANVLGFFVVFATVLAAGALITLILDRLLKFAHLSWLNRLLGGAFGLVRGIVISMLIVMLLMAFSTKEPPHAVAHSRIAPHVMGSARVLARATPREIREGFDRSYEKIKAIWAEMFDKKPKRPAEQDL